MRNDAFQIDACVDQLLAVLDADIQHLENSLVRLNTLRGLVIKRDHDALSHLLTMVQAELKRSSDNESRRKTLCKQLAVLIGCQPDQVTLSRIGLTLAGPQKSELDARKSKLALLTTRLKNEYSSTRLLLIDCARFNKMLIKGIFDACQLVPATYSPDGTAQRQTNTVFMSLQF
jgi:hypothetical protein